MSNKKLSLIVSSIVAFFVANYIATVIVLAWSMRAWEDSSLLLRIFERNLSPWAEWRFASAYGLVPILLVISYVAVFVHVVIVFSVCFFYVLALDIALVAPLPHVTSERFTMHVLFRALRLAIAGVIGAGLSEMVLSRLVGRSTLATKHKATGFTLVEVLVVLTIVMLLMGIVFAVVGSAKSRSKLTVDISQMRQVYMSVILYEGDTGECPHSLLQTRDYVSAKALFKSPSDDVPKVSSDFPANLFVFDSPQRSQFRISYAYLRAFEGSDLWSPRLDWSTFRSDPGVGILANKFYVPKAPKLIDQKKLEHDFVRTVGKLHRIRMDGSLWSANPRDGFSVGGSINGLFVDP
jgi:type II secretory pathway pseudopilin PulG